MLIVSCSRKRKASPATCVVCLGNDASTALVPCGHAGSLEVVKKEEVVPVAAVAEAASAVQMDNHKDKGEDVIVVDVNGSSGKKKSRYM